MRESFTRTLGGDVHDEAWLQATRTMEGANHGLRKTEVVALPTFTSNRTAAGPRAVTNFNRTEEQSLAPRVRLGWLCWQRANQAIERFFGSNPADSSPLVLPRGPQSVTRRARIGGEAMWRARRRRAHHLVQMTLTPGDLAQAILA